MKHCFVIPVYNHPHYLAALLSHLSAFELPIIMVNDGSDTDTPTLARVTDIKYTK